MTFAGGLTNGLDQPMLSDQGSPETCLVNPCVKFHRPHSPVLFPLCLTAFAQILPFLLELARMDVPTRASDVTSSNTSEGTNDYTPVTCFSLCSICDKELIKVQHSKEKCIIAGQHLNGFSPSAYHHVAAPSSRNRSGWKALNSSLRSSIQALEAPRPKIRRKCLHF